MATATTCFDHRVRVSLAATLLLGLMSAARGVGAMETEDSTTLLLQELLNGGVVTEQVTAIGIAEAVIADAYGADELERQRPLTAIDRGESWIVEGSFNRDRECEQVGPLTINIQKRDAAITDLTRPFIVCLPQGFPHRTPD